MSRYAVHLVRDPLVAFGRVCLRGSRISVEVIVERFIAGESISELVIDYDMAPALVEEALRVMLHAASNRRGDFPVALMRRLADLVPMEPTR